MELGCIRRSPSGVNDLSLIGALPCNLAEMAGAVVGQAYTLSIAAGLCAIMALACAQRTRLA